jgi:hypothetical protein
MFYFNCYWKKYYCSGENFVGSSRCAVCHELLTDSKGNDMSNAGHRRSTMMAKAAAAITK